MICRSYCVLRSTLYQSDVYRLSQLMLTTDIISTPTRVGGVVKASGFPPSLPGRKRITRLNWQRVSDLRTCRRVSILVVVKYSKFLWSVMTSIGKADPLR